MQCNNTKSGIGLESSVSIIGITLSLAHHYLTPSYQHFNITQVTHVVDWFVAIITFETALNLGYLAWIIWIQKKCDGLKFGFAVLVSVIITIIVLFLSSIIIVYVEFFKNIELNTLRSIDIFTLINLTILYSSICIFPMIYIFISRSNLCCEQWLWSRMKHKYIIIICFISLIILFVFVLATLHHPGSSTQKWEDAVNYNYISVGNFIFFASQVAVTTSIFSLLTVLYYYAIIAQHNIVVNNKHQDSLLSGSSRKRGYGSTTLTVKE